MTTARRVSLPCFLVLVLLLCGVLPAQSTVTASRYLEQVEAMASAKDKQGRAAAITDRLDQLGIRYQTLPFEIEGRKGVNLLADVAHPLSSSTGSGSPRTLLLGAHYDKVKVGQGALDNASGVSAVLELASALKRQPLKNLRVQAVFFDLEEEGLLGSRSFVDSPPGGRLPDFYLNFDIFGYGDSLWVMSQDKASESAKAIIAAGADSNFPVEVTPDYPPGDDRSFVKARVETLGIALIKADEAKAVMKLFNGQRVEPLPRILTIMHRAEDTPDKLSQEDVARAIPVVERAVRLIDSANR